MTSSGADRRDDPDGDRRGPDEEQNAALACAVIGGPLFATPTTVGPVS
jgi:hypothetical protein